MMTSRIFLAFTILLTASCAETGGMGAHEKSVQTANVTRQYLRLIDVAGPVNLANASSCGEDAERTIGAEISSPGGLGAQGIRITVSDSTGPGGTADPAAYYAIALARGGPAEQAGMRMGDRIVSINGEDLIETKARNRKVSYAPGTNRVAILRDGEPMSLDIPTRMACAYPVRVIPSESVNAYATGDTILMTLGMMEFLETDDEIAVIYGHELAHNARNHLADAESDTVYRHKRDLYADLFLQSKGDYKSVLKNATIDPKLQTYSQSREREADYFGVYYAAIAGFDISNAAALWQRMKDESDGFEYKASLYPTDDERIELVSEAQREIEAKRAAGEALVPSSPPESASGS